MSKKDFDYLLELKNKILKFSVLKLNKLHNKNYPIRIWDIIIGYWLFKFITVSYDRWKFIKNNLKKLEINSSYEINIFDIPQNSQEATIFFFDDRWISFFNYIHKEILGLNNPIDIATVQENNNNHKLLGK